MSIFSKVAAPKVKRSTFNLSEEVKLSMNFGDLVPICCKEILPGDKMKISTELLIKFAPLAAPVMHRIQAYVHYFFVPNFQISSVFEKFINPKVNTESSPVVLPYCLPKNINSFGADADGSLIGTLADYLGLPVTESGWMNSTNTKEAVSILPFVAYQHIYNSYYRDQNLEVLEPFNPSGTLYGVEQNLGLSGAVATSLGSVGMTNLFKLRKRAWAKDYFTSALPSPQAGDDVILPVGGTAPVTLSSDGPLRFDGEDSELEGTATWSYDDDPSAYLSGDGEKAVYSSGLSGEADLSDASAVSINDLRRAMALQRFKELAERGGTRYPEMVRNFFGAFLPDFYVDRPVFLGGQKLPIKIGEVVQTSRNEASDDEYLGQRAGIASGYGFTKTAYLKAPCHGFLFGILSIRPEATYQQGVERMWTRRSIYDFAFPQFANLGEQEIKVREIFASSDSDDNDATFGYAPRYAEYKDGHCHICGEFRNSLKDWHFGRIFTQAPTLSKEFVMMDNVRYDPFNVVDSQTEHIYVNCYNTIIAKRPLPYFGTPSIL